MIARFRVHGLRWAGRYGVVAVGLACGGLVLSVGQASALRTAAAETLYVSSTGSNSGTCLSTSPCATVSYALTKAASGATIEVSGTIKDRITISSPVTITTWYGGPAGSPGILDGAEGGIVVTNNAAGVTIKAMTIEGGAGNSNAGGIYNKSAGSMTLIRSTLTDNTGSGYARGFFNGGTMTVTDSTIAGNSGGSAIENSSPNLRIIASTIADNSGGGIASGATGAVAVLGATIVADNTGYNCKTDSTTSYTSAGYNLTNDKSGTTCSFTAATDRVNKNPLLASLGKNGGPTETLLPVSTSPAADVIPNPTTLDGVKVCPGTDQRGVVRPGNGEARCTIGAVEVSASQTTTSSVTATPAKVKAGARVAFLIVVTPKSGTGTPTGPVAFAIGSTKLCTAVLSGGDAACGATNAPVGTDTVTGTYSGGGGYAASSGTTTLTVTTS